MIKVFIGVLLFRLIIGLIELAKANRVPYEQEESEPIESYCVVYDCDKEQRKREEQARRERERIQREIAQRIAKQHRRELAEADLAFYSAELQRITAESARLERLRAEETAPTMMDKLDRRIERLNREAHAADKKRMIAYNTIHT